MAAPITTPEEVTAEWLAGVLGLEAVESVDVVAIGTGQMSTSLRATYEAADGPGSVVVKIAASDPTSRATGVGLGAYRREVSFYSRLGERMPPAVPRCHFAAYDEQDGWFTLVLDDASPAEVGDQIAGCTPGEARLAVSALAEIHAPVLGDPALGSEPWLNAPNPLDQALYQQLLPGFLERYEGRIAPEHVAVCKAFGGCLDAWYADRRPPLGLVHGDYRLDNLLFSADGCTVVDWQTVSWGSALLDLSYFLASSLTVEDRRAHERELVDLYYDGLGVSGLSREQCFEEYRRQGFFGILMAVVASMIVERTERGDEMFMTTLSRYAQQVLDLDALDLLPADGDSAVPALVPDPADEGLHDADADPLFNESFYFDAVSDDADLGVYLRLGRMPGADACFYAVCICGPGRPSVMLVLEGAPLPDAGDAAQVVDVPSLHAEHHCEEPLQRFRVKLSGEAGAHDDPAAPLRSEAGTPIPIELDLTWETDAVPYAWRLTTRYEIPCRVTGTVRVGDEEIAFAGPGQRDHSWGVRDWWAVDWMWSALHLDDGTRLHGVGIPGSPGHGVGYVQRDGSVAELEAVDTTHSVASDGLIADPVIKLQPQGIELDVEPLAWGALRLEAPDGRLSFFPRAMCRVVADDGRTGTGWVEWNCIQPTES